MTGEPVWDPGLQPERTTLAWRRTALAGFAASLAGLRIVPALLGPMAYPAAVSATAAAIVIFILAEKRATTRRRLFATMTGSAPRTLGGALMIGTAGLVACAGLSAATVALIEYSRHL